MSGALGRTEIWRIRFSGTLLYLLGAALLASPALGLFTGWQGWEEHVDFGVLGLGVVAGIVGDGFRSVAHGLECARQDIGAVR